jgi:serine protease Do
VRQVEMKGVDLSLFQFDHDLNWAAMFINADGVVYARYGTQSAAGPDAYNSIEGLARTMRRVLKLHEAYPKNADALAGKHAKAKPYKTALEMPGLPNKDQRYGKPTARNNCIHCHNIHDAENIYAQESGTFTQDMLWRYPLPENIGLVIDGKDGIRVKEVTADSPAGRAGFEAGEDIVAMNGQPMTSIADIQWVLNGLPNTDTEVRVRGSASGAKTLALAKGWKKSDISWRGSLWSVQPRLRVWAPALTEKEREERGLPASRDALLVKWINRGSPGGRSAYESGLREGDVVVALAGKPIHMTTQQFNMHIKLNYKVGDELPLTVLRDGKKRDVRVKLVE